MSTLRVTNIQHPNAEDPAIELSPSGGVLLSGVGDAPSGSTGAPWDLPFPVAGEAFGTQAIEDLAEATADGLSMAGKVEQVVASTYANNVVSTSSTSYVNMADMSVSITPKSADNLIIAIMYVNGAATGDNRRSAFYRLLRGGTQIMQAEFASSHSSVTPVRLDAPGTTSSITYQGQFRSSRTDRGARARDRQIVLIEVKND